MITRRSQSQMQGIKLRDYIAIPSETQIYSIGVEYMKRWFLEQFDDGYFKTIHINGKHIFDDARLFDRERLTKQPEMPAVAIIPTVEHSYNRDTVDLRLGGRQILNRRTRFYQDGIIQDYDNNIFLNMIPKQVQMNFTFRVRVSSKAEQIDLANFMTYAFRVGATQGKNVSYDFHIPREIMLNIAQSAGFELDFTNDIPRVKNIVSYLDYLNRHSVYPILYKLRTINGNSEFFIRVPGMYTHITNTDELSLDDGEQIDQITSKYHIDMNCTLLIPGPQLYYYYSKDEVDKRFKTRLNFAGLYTLPNIISPEKDDNGWPQYLSTEWVDDDLDMKTINFEELMEDKDLMEVIRYTKSTFISPGIFVSIKLYNHQREIPISIDWENFNINLLTDEPLVSETSELTVYVDLGYMNETLSVIKDLNSSRFD